MFTPCLKVLSALWWSSTAFRRRRLLSPKHQTPRWDSMFPVLSDMLGTLSHQEMKSTPVGDISSCQLWLRGEKMCKKTPFLSSTYQNQMNIWFKYTSLKKTPWNTHWHQKCPGGPVQPLWASQALSSQPRWILQRSMKVNLTAFLEDKNHNIVDMCFCLPIKYI